MGLFARLSHKIADNLVRSNVIKEEDAEIYIYGINQIFVSVLIGLILGMFLESVIFLAAYIPLRSFAGGYHAKTPMRCYFASLLIIFAALLFCKHMCFSLPLFSVILVIGIAACVFLCPVQDNNKPLDSTECQRCKKISFVVLFVEICFWIIINFVIHKYEQIIPVSIFAEAIMMVTGKVKNDMIQKV